MKYFGILQKPKDLCITGTRMWLHVLFFFYCHYSLYMFPNPTISITMFYSIHTFLSVSLTPFLPLFPFTSTPSLPAIIAIIQPLFTKMNALDWRSSSPTLFLCSSPTIYAKTKQTQTVNGHVNMDALSLTASYQLILTSWSPYFLFLPQHSSNFPAVFIECLDQISLCVNVFVSVFGY